MSLVCKRNDQKQSETSAFLLILLFHSIIKRNNTKTKNIITETNKTMR